LKGEKDGFGTIRQYFGGIGSGMLGERTFHQHNNNVLVNIKQNKKMKKTHSSSS